MTLASVVISGAMRSPSRALRSAKLSTSPLSDATTNGAPSSPSSALSTGWALGWLMMPTDAHRVAQHDRDGVVGRHRQAQQVVGAQGVAQRPGVVAQLADLGRGLVDERQAPVDQAHGARPEQRVGGPPPQQPRDGRAVDVEPVVAHEHVDARRVAPPHLEPVDRRQRLLDRRVRLGGAPTRLAAGEVGHGSGGAHAVLLDRPHRVLQPDHGGVHRLELGGVVLAAVGGGRGSPSSPSVPSSRRASSVATLAARVVHSPSISASRRRSWTSAHTPSAPRSSASVDSTPSAAAEHASASGAPPRARRPRRGEV